MSKSATKAANTKPKKGGRKPKKEETEPTELALMEDIDLDFPDEDVMAPNTKDNKDGVEYIRPCRVCGAPVENDWEKLCGNEQCHKAYAKKWNVFKRKPTKYRPEFASKELHAYMEWVEDMNNHIMYKTKSGFVPLNKVEVPGRLGYSGFIGVNRTTLYNWEDAHPAFADALEKLDYFSEMYITNMVNMGLLNPGIAKLLLGNRHGIIEKKETENKHLHAIGWIEDIHKEADRLDSGQA